MCVHLAGFGGDIVDLRTAQGQADAQFEDMACAWMDFLADGKRPPSWSIHDRLVAEGKFGILVPSFAPGAGTSDQNLVLWSWGEGLPHQVKVIDPEGRLPRNQLSGANAARVGSNCDSGDYPRRPRERAFRVIVIV
ncbi:MULTISPECIES: RES domain-containing protein [unclassified Mesorhizobium]|uniref:RES domain-containing protein n=1 Tax=unclassified Mesorhizobium TaxID=325217 RepID=UPI00333BA42D